jgi:hypothetical protein
MVGQKGGKNWVVEGAVVYTLYKLCCMLDPHGYFKVDRSKTISIANSSLKGERQAKEVFFNNVKSAMKLVIDPTSNRNWFEEHVGFDFSKAGDMQTKSILLPNAGNPKIQVHSFDSTADAPEGLLVFWGIMDEPSRANTPPRYRDAKRLLKVYRGNAKGSFKKWSKIIGFSYPEQEVNDLTFERFEHVKNTGQPLKYGFERPGVYVIKAATWEFDPTKNRELYNDEYDTDPIDSACRFECIVPKARFGFFKPFDHKIKECAVSMPDKIIYTPTQTLKIVRDPQGRSKQRRVYTGIEVVRVLGDSRPRVIALDVGVKHDRFVIGGGYLEKLDIPVILEQARQQVRDGEAIDTSVRRALDIDPVSAVERLTAIPVMDWFVVWEPTRLAPVDFTDVEDFVIDHLIPRFPDIRLFVSDRYQSEALQHKVMDRGIPYVSMLMSNSEQLRGYYKLRRLIWNNATKYADHPILIRELEQLLKLTSGKVDHPGGAGGEGSKDFADVLMLGVTKLIEVLGEEAAQTTEEDTAALEKRFATYVTKYVGEHHRAPSLEDIQRDMRVSAELALTLAEDLSIAEDDAPVQRILAEHGVDSETEPDTTDL